MINAGVDVISQKMDKTNLSESGVSFQGKTLKLDKAEDWDKIVDAIEKCERLDFLNLEGNTLGVDASKAIAKALESKPELKRALWKDIFTGRMKEEIPKALLNLGCGLTLAGARLTELDMSDNAFGPIGVEGLAGLLSSPTCYQLQQLKLNNNGLGISGGKMLAKSLIQCYENSLKEGKPLALKVFIAGRNRLENEGAKALSKVFEKLGSLEEVVMPQNGIYPKGIEALSKSFTHNKNLRVINLNDNTVTKAGATSIAKALPYLKKLQILNLGDCLLKTGGAEVIATALTDGQCDLKELYMSFNEIKCSGGIAIAKAMKDKDKLQILNLDGNNFGEEGCASITKVMEDINRGSALGTLDDDEGCDESGSENSGSEKEDGSGSEQEDENGSETDANLEISQTQILSPKSPNAPVNGKKESDVLSNIIQNMSIGDKETDPVYKFLSCPSLGNFKEINKKMINNYIQNIENSSSDFYLDKLIQLIMKISSLSNSKDDSKVQIMDLTFDLYKTLFSWARNKNQTSAVNNALVVYLGLIKSEDKTFKVDWDTEGSISALISAISKGIVPNSTEQVLNFCLKREQKM